MQTYRPRRIVPLAPLTQGGWFLKRYAITYGDAVFDHARFEGALALALAAVPAPAVTPERPGVGFVIEHQGNAFDYAIVAWWDRENELPLRVFVREQQPGAEWRPGHGSESVCVWDLQVIWAEREAYVTTVLGPLETGGRESYIARTFRA
jgi:hypothetical protein